MSYDYHGAWDGKTGHNSPLYGRKNEPEKDRLWNINSSIHIWMGTCVFKLIKKKNILLFF